MATKNFTIKSNNGAGWDTLHPKTNMAQVEGLELKINEIDAIAKGASKAKVFDTVAELDAWLAVAANKATLQVGDNLYIRAKGVPDYWWDGTAKQELETEKVNLEFATATNDGLMTKGDKTKLDGIATGATKVTSPSDIGAATAAQGTKADNAVSFTAQTLTEAQKSQARTNIGAGDGTGTYSKPVNGIPKSDLEAAVQTSLGKADSALQSIPFETTNGNIKASGTATAGTSGKVADAAHIHPAQTTVSGNAGTADKLSAAKTFALTGDVTGSVSADLSVGMSIAATQVANKSNQKVAVSKNSTTATGTRKQINFKDGSNVTVTVVDNATNDAVDITIAATDTTYNAATTSVAGLMSAADKTKIDKIPVITMGTTAPTSPSVGDLWYDENNN